MGKIKTTDRCDPVVPSTRSQYHATLVAVILLCIFAPNMGAADESIPLIDYTLSASPSPETPLAVDDDLEVKVNGETAFIDDDEYATLDGRASWKGAPITFSALPGEIMQNFTNSFRLISEFEKYCNDRYAESEILIGKLEVVHSSFKAAEPITKDEILPLVEENLAALRMMSGVEAQKERGIRMCEKLIELLHIATLKTG